MDRRSDANEWVAEYLVDGGIAMEKSFGRLLDFWFVEGTPRGRDLPLWSDLLFAYRFSANHRTEREWRRQKRALWTRYDQSNSVITVPLCITMNCEVPTNWRTPQHQHSISSMKESNAVCNITLIIIIIVVVFADHWKKWKRKEKKPGKPYHPFRSVHWGDDGTFAYAFWI